MERPGSKLVVAAAAVLSSKPMLELPAARAVFDAIATRDEAIVAALIELVDIPSVAAAPARLEEAAAAVGRQAAAAGFAVELWPTAGAPVVFAEIPAPDGAPVLLFYGHYDVQPAEPLEAWRSPPFNATVRDGAVYGRGAGDNKGQLLAHIEAMRALRATGGCPVGVKLLVEGEEEVGSPNLAAIVREKASRLQCDVAITADGPFHADGRPMIVFGVRGLVYLEAVAEGAGRDLHSGSHGGWAPAPARMLIRALADLWDETGAVTVPGFYDDVRPATAAELELARRLPAPGAAGRGADGDGWVTLMFQPNLNISGIAAGYAGAGMQTIVPARATAKLDVRLAADQDPDRIYGLLRRRLAADGIEVRRIAAVPPSSTPVDNPFTAPVARALEAATGEPPWLQPRLGGTTPDFVFTRILAVPSLIVPYGPPDMHHHAPNERLALTALRRGVRSSAAICLALAESGTAR